MKLETIAIHSPGDMGQAVAGVLAQHGLRVTAALDGRSARTRRLAGQVGIEDLGSLEALVQAADVVLSILVPHQAEAAARDIATAMTATGAAPLYVDCNAIAADTSRRIGATVAGAGARYVDASIIGPPPRRAGVTRFYAAGPDSHAFAGLARYGLDIRVLDGPLGHASSLKTCYASLTKGLQALGTELLVGARALNLDQPLAEELRLSQPMLYAWLEKSIPNLPAKAHRWVGEMEEHGEAYAAQGLTPKIMEGAAELYRFVADTPIGRETPEEAAERSLEDVIIALAAALPQRPR